MKKLFIDVDFLSKYSPCSGGLEQFKAAFPNGIELTDDQMTNFERLGGVLPRHYDTEGGPKCSGIDLAYEWLLGNLGYIDNNDLYGMRNVGCGTSYDCSHDEFLVAGLLADAVGVYVKE
jgi:hypothetical protein